VSNEKGEGKDEEREKQDNGSLNGGREQRVKRR